MGVRFGKRNNGFWKWISGADQQEHLEQKGLEIK
jgi:hypothetical protein